LTADVGFRSEPKFCGDGSTEFDGSADKVTAAHYNPSGDYLTATAWVNADTIRFQGLIYNGSTGRNSFLFYMLSTGALRFYWNDTTGDARIEHQTALTANRWYHLAAVMDMSDPADHQVTFYIDGIAATGTRTANGFSGDNNYGIGLEYASTGWFDGKIADCRIFDVELTQDQIRELYNNPGLDFPSGLTASNLRRHYKLETDFNDSGADSENATASGSPSFTVDRPQLPRGLDLARGASMARVYTGRAVDFDGSADRITAAHYNPGGDYLTTTAWVNADTIRNQGIVHNGNTGRNSFLFYMGGSGSLIFYWNDTTGDAYILHQTPLKAGQWHHLVMVLDMSDPADHQVTCYIDGITATGTRTASSWVGDNTYQFGNQYGTAGWFDGKIADCRIYDVALTQAQIRELYHNPEQVLPTGVSASNLRRYYPLSDYNDTGGTGGRYFQDMGADGEPAEDLGSALMSFAQPVPCPQLGLQQSASRISMQNTTNNTYYVSGVMSGTPFTNQGTLSGWFIMQELPGTTSGDYNPIFILGKYQTNKDLLEIAYDNNSVHGQPNIWLTDGGGSVAVRYNHVFELGKLQHVVVTTLATSPYWQLWINGEKKTVSAKTFSASRTAWDFGDNKLSGGRWGDGPYGGVCHFIPVDTAAWNTVLSDSEVTQVYNSGVPGDVSGIASANLQAWWKCDDLSEFKDFSGNGVSGTVVSGSVAPGLASFPENASGSTIVGDFSMKRKGVSVVNLSGTTGVNAIIPNNPAVFPTLATGFSFTCALRRQEEGSFGSVLFGSNNNSSRNPPSSPPYYNHQFLAYLAGSGSVQFNVGEGTAGGNRATLFSTSGAFSGSMYIGGMTVYGIDTETAIANPRFYQAVLSPSEMEQAASSDLRLVKGLNNE
jgi:hypothetical protein